MQMFAHSLSSGWKADAWNFPHVCIPSGVCCCVKRNSRLIPKNRLRCSQAKAVEGGGLRPSVWPESGGLCSSPTACAVSFFQRLVRLPAVYAFNYSALQCRRPCNCLLQGIYPIEQSLESPAEPTRCLRWQSEWRILSLENRAPRFQIRSAG